MKFPVPRLGLIAAVSFFSQHVGFSAARENASFRPALVGNGPKSLVNLIDGSKLMREGQQDAVVMFDAVVVDDGGGFVSSFECHGSPGSDRLKKEVSKELLRAAFIPALANGRPAGVFFRGSVVFAVRNGRPQLQVFANQDREELARGSDFIEPQLILGTDDWKEAKPYLEVLRKQLRHGIAVVSITVDAEGNRKEMHLVREDPPGLNIGAAALKTLSTAQFIPAFRNGHAVAATFEMSNHMYGYRSSR
jgi:Gram-negative bacterial TonB protein C-terminal